MNLVNVVWHDGPTHDRWTLLDAGTIFGVRQTSRLDREPLIIASRAHVFPLLNMCVVCGVSVILSA